MVSVPGCTRLLLAVKLILKSVLEREGDFSELWLPAVFYRTTGTVFVAYL